jgi:hypothetical protein
VVNVTLEDNTAAPVYVWSPVVVTSAPRLEVEDTSSDVALVIAAFRSKIPVISNCA